MNILHKLKMVKLIVSISLVACVFGAAIPDGLIPQLNGRVVGGIETTIEAFPYQISLQKFDAHTCGGSLYSSSVVITAAHCVENAIPYVLAVRAGSTSKSSGGIVAKVASITMHPLYETISMVYDIAIVRLASPLPLGANIRPIKMADSTPADGTIAKVTGWGAMRSESPIRPDKLRYVEVKIIEKSKCSSSAYSYGEDITSTTICAANKGKDACQGDSGGPLVVADGQVGVVSWGYGCAEAVHPGIYTDVAALKSWIVENV